jgi:hypothetical protein
VSKDILEKTMDYQTITPPFWKGYILIECQDGKIYKYVRDVTKRMNNTTWNTGIGRLIQSSWLRDESPKDMLSLYLDDRTLASPANPVLSSWIFGPMGFFSWKQDFSQSYIWGDSIGDTIGMTGDTAGRIFYDFNRICTYYQSLMSTKGALMKWPESTGDTTALRRLNKEQLQPFSASSPNNPSLYQIPGDTLGYRLYNLAAFTWLKIPVSKIQSISLIQERIPDWYKAQQGVSLGPYPSLKV